ncbi:MAG: STAS/SEC14 domain-containing protein [Sphingomonas sp.]|uniref:STAS/SEC14 domain-containing protein n=1 Tax=Sphingomonas sp. TaxID=28214 RepID=UPI003F80504E
MLSYTVDEAAGVIDLLVDGEITRADYETLIPVLEAQIARHGKLRVVETVRKLGPIDPSLWWEDLKWVVRHRGVVGRAAVVTDHGWIGPITRAAGALFSGEMRVFPESQGDAARAWVREA